METDIQKSLQHIGVSTRIIGVIAGAVAIAYIAQMYFEIKRTRLEIRQLENELS